MARLRSRPKKWDRFSKWAPGAAMLVAVIALAMLLAAALTATDPAADAAPGVGAPGPESAETGAETAAETGAAQPAANGRLDALGARLDLHRGIVRRLDEGEGYYSAAIAEHRAAAVPLQPGLTVRLPLLAMVAGWAGAWGMGMLAVVLALLTLIAWWRKLDDEPGGREYRGIVLLFLLAGMAASWQPLYLALHEVWAGGLIALALGLHRPGRWLAALVVATLALMMHALALPFVLLMGALALGRGLRSEALAWGLLATAFGVVLMIHLVQVALLVNPDDLVAAPWLALRGLGGWTGNIAAASALHLMPGWLAAPIVLLPLLGWAGWRSDTGLTGLLLGLVYGLIFTIAGRADNFSWALVVLPVWFIGLAFVPRALASLWHSVRDF